MASTVTTNFSKKIAHFSNRTIFGYRLLFLTLMVNLVAVSQMNTGSTSVCPNTPHYTYDEISTYNPNI